jgi:hypothetical protein
MMAELTGGSIVNVVVDTCNPSYYDRGRQEDCSSRPAPGKKLARLPSQQTSWEWWCQFVTPATWGSIGKRTMVQGWPGQKFETLSKN